MPKATDAEVLRRLVRRCREGDGEAFDQVFARFRGPLYAYLARTTGDAHLAQDMLQDVFLRMVENLDRYRESGRFEAWLFRIAANRVRDWARRRRRREFVGGPAGGPEEDVGLTVDRAVHRPPEDPLIRQEESRRLEAALATLSDGERELLVLRHYGGLSFREIAEAVGAPLGTVLARSHRALLKLRDALGES